MRNLGLRVISDSLLEYPARLVYTKIFQPRAYQIDSWTRKLIRKYCYSNAVCVDIGAYRGDILCLFLQEAVDGQHIGFKPNPINCRHLKRRFPTSQIEQVALDNRSGLKTFLRGRDRPARSRLATMGSKGQMASSATEQLELLVTKLDDYFGNDDRADFIKIDAEGVELEILQGGIKVLSANQPFMVIEHGLTPSQSAVTKLFELFQLVHKELRLEIFSLDRLVTEIPNSADFIDSLRAGSNYFFTTPKQ